MGVGVAVGVGVGVDDGDGAALTGSVAGVLGLPVFPADTSGGDGVSVPADVVLDVANHHTPSPIAIKTTTVTERIIHRGMDMLVSRWRGIGSF